MSNQGLIGGMYGIASVAGRKWIPWHNADHNVLTLLSIDGWSLH